MKYHTHSNKDLVRRVRRRRLMKRALKMMVTTCFIVGLLMVISAIAGEEQNVKAYIEFKNAVCAGFGLMGFSLLFARLFFEDK